MFIDKIWAAGCVFLGFLFLVLFITAVVKWILKATVKAYHTEKIPKYTNSCYVCPYCGEPSKNMRLIHKKYVPTIEDLITDESGKFQNISNEWLRCPCHNEMSWFDMVQKENVMDPLSCRHGELVYTSEDESTYDYVCYHSNHEGEGCPLGYTCEAEPEEEK